MDSTIIIIIAAGIAVTAAIVGLLVGRSITQKSNLDIEKKAAEEVSKKLNEAKATADKLKNVFTWKHYFEVNRITETIPSRKTKQFKMSPKCTVEVEELAGPQVAVTLIGEGKPVNKTTYPLKKGGSINIAGEGKDGSAWFVLITELDEK